MHPHHEFQNHLTRRTFIGQSARGVGGLALGSMLFPELLAAGTKTREGGLAGLPHFAPKAKRVLCLFQSGGMSHVDLFDDKPALHEFAGKDLPPSIKGTQRLTGMTSGQKGYPVRPPLMDGKACGKHGTWISNLIPHIQSIADDICIIKTLNTEAINHDPAITFLNTGNQQPGYASMGAWASYGLGTENANLPAFIAMVSQGTGKNPGQPVFSRLWGSGFLPGAFQGVQCRASGDPVLYVQNPPGVQPGDRRITLDALAQLNAAGHRELGDPETLTRTAQYEMAFRMQASVPDLTDLSKETPATLDLYGPEVKESGTFAHSALLARRMVERGVRVVQILHRGWDQHGNLPKDIARQCQQTDQACAGLLLDLQSRGMLEDTLVVWGGEFGRTVYSQGTLTKTNYGRDHHPRCFTMWMAGGGVKPGISYGETDDFSYNVTKDPVHLSELNATILHLMGVDHRRLTYKFQGLDQRLTGVEERHVIKGILA